MSKLNKWDKRFLRIAYEVAHWSKDPSHKIGAVAVKDKRIIATGYNGFPSGVEDIDYRWRTKELKYQYIVHAEMNCVYNAVNHGISLKDATMYVYGLPVCHECAKGIVQSGITRIVGAADLSNGIPTKWFDSYKKTVAMLDEIGVQFVLTDSITLMEEI